MSEPSLKRRIDPYQGIWLSVPLITELDASYLTIVAATVEEIAALRVQTQRKCIRFDKEMAHVVERRALVRLGLASEFETGIRLRLFWTWQLRVAAVAVDDVTSDSRVTRMGRIRALIRGIYRHHGFEPGSLDYERVANQLSSRYRTLVDPSTLRRFTKACRQEVGGKDFTFLNSRCEFELDWRGLRDALKLREVKPRIHESEVTAWNEATAVIAENADPSQLCLDREEAEQLAFVRDEVDRIRASAIDHGDHHALAAIEHFEDSAINSMPKLSEKYGISVKAIRVARERFERRIEAALLRKRRQKEI